MLGDQWFFQAQGLGLNTECGPTTGMQHILKSEQAWLVPGWEN